MMQVFFLLSYFAWRISDFRSAFSVSGTPEANRSQDRTAR
jgi:hypothetical protein